MLPVDLLPFAGLRLVVPDPAGDPSQDVELRAGDLDGVVGLARLAADGIVPAGRPTPFAGDWADCAPDERARRVLRWQLAGWGSWTAGSWRLDFVVRRGGVVVGTQSLEADGFAVRREVATGSWLGLAHQGRGTGRLMRSAVLQLAFGHLGALAAVSTAFVDNAASQGVSRRLGYREDGLETREREGHRALLQRFRLDAGDWADHHLPGVLVEGAGPVVEACCGAGDAAQQDDYS